MHRSRLPWLLALPALFNFCVAIAQTTSFPNKPVRLIVSFSPGGSVDTTARQLGPVLQELWKQPVIVENRAGADGNIAAELVARTTSDGYTLLITSNSISITPALRKLPFDPLNDLMPVIRVLSIPNFLVTHPSLPVNSVGELVALAKSKPNELSFASAGTGTTPFMGMALLQTLTGARMIHVPYKGTAPAVLATLGNQTQLMFGDVNSTLPQVRAGRFKVLGVSSLQRSHLAPEVPTIAESGQPGFDTSTWVGIFAPGGTPSALVDSIARDVAAVLRTPGFQEIVRKMGAQPNGETADAFVGIMKADIERWTRVVRELNIKASD